MQNHQETKQKKSVIRPAYYYAIPLLLEKIRSDEELQQLAHPDIAALRKWDMENDTDWLHTYFTYLRNDRNVVRTAAELHIHRNTLSYRLDRIRELLTANEDNFEERMHLLLTMYANNDRKQ